MLGDVSQDEIGGNRRHLVEARFTEFAFDVVFRCKTKAAVSLQADVGRFPRRVGRMFDWAAHATPASNI